MSIFSIGQKGSLFFFFLQETQKDFILTQEGGSIAQW